MKNAIISGLLLGAAHGLFVPPAVANIHDFNAQNVRPIAAQPTHKPGECYKTENQSNVCYMQSKDRKIVAAIIDANYPGYATVLAVDCTTGQFYSYGQKDNRIMTEWSHAICRDN